MTDVDLMYLSDTLAEAKVFIDDSFRKALAHTLGDKEVEKRVEKKTPKIKKSAESLAKQLRREEVAVKVVAAKEMCHRMFAASSNAAVADSQTVTAQISPATSSSVGASPAQEFAAQVPQSFSELLSGSLEAANYGYMPTYSNLPVRKVVYLLSHNHMNENANCFRVTFSYSQKIAVKICV